MASENGRYRGLLVDYGGVLTSNLFDSFRSFCELEGLEPEEIGRRFRKDPACRELLIGLETGKLPEADFENGARPDILGVEGAGPDRPAVRRVARLSRRCSRRCVEPVRPGSGPD